MGIVTPHSFQQGRELPAGHITILTNPTFIVINPGTETNGEQIDVAQGDLFVRLKYHPSEIEQDPFDVIHHIITVASFETQFTTMRILGELE